MSPAKKKLAKKDRGGSDGGNEDDLIDQYVHQDDEMGNNDAPNDQMIDDIFQAKSTLHADDAVDYEDIDELADDDEVFSDSLQTPLAQNHQKQELMDIDSADEENQQQQANKEFEAMFGNADDDANDQDNLSAGDVQNNRLLAGGLENDHLMDDDGLDGINMGDIYDDYSNAEDVPASVPEVNDATTMKREREDDVFQQQQRQLKKLKLSAIVQKMEKTQIKRNLRYHFPDYSVHKPFNNHKLFLPEPKYYRYSIPPIAFRPKPLVPTKVNFTVDYDQKKLFKSGKYVSNYDSRLNITDILENDLKLLEKIAENNGLHSRKLVPLPYLTKDGSGDDKFTQYNKDLILATADWDDDAIINATTKDSTGRANFRFDIEKDQEAYDEEDENEEDENIFNGLLDVEKIKLDMNDPNLLFERDKPKDRALEKSRANALVPVNEKLMELKFNVSNDKQYELFNSNYNVKVRSQIGNLNIEHSVPALRLQSPFYKVRLNKDDARSFHRPKFSIRAGSLISFLKLKPRKRKKDKGKSPKEIFNRTTDLTSGDSGTIIGMEYAEEYPMIMSKFGMGSKLINYYRREKPDDNSRPKAPLGETHVLGVEDRSPFWNFGYVAKGDFVPTLYNNMIRAPIFQHEKKSTDFLLVKSQGGGMHQRYYLRNIDHLFGVGHTFPSVEVPAPHSRKVTNTSKNRLKMVVFRTMNKKGRARISVRDISHHFPDQNDMQNRQRLKEFMEYQRLGEDQGFWKIKNRDTVPSEESIRMMISPEDVSLLDSMQSGVQLLDDLSIFFNEEQEKERVKKEKNQELDESKKKDNKDKDKKDKKEDNTEEGIDEQLMSWNLSRNFTLANQTKSMLQLNGEGDPTGIGLGFSFLKTSQKSAFTPFYPPPKENVPKSNQAAYQQRIYDEEIARIWYSQRKSLTVDPNQANRSLKQVYAEYKPLNHEQYLKKKYDETNSDLNKNNKALRINRRFRDENGIVQRKVEVIKDPRVIKAYLKKKKQIEDELIKNANLEDIIPTNDKELNKIRRKALEEKLANLERRAKHNKGRKPASKDPLHVAIAAGGKAIDANTVLLPDGSYAFGGKGIGKGKSTTRRCAACGAFGHIRTKKSCPLYNQTQGGKIDITTNKPFNPEKTEAFESGATSNLDFD